MFNCPLDIQGEMVCGPLGMSLWLKRATPSDTHFVAVSDWMASKAMRQDEGRERMDREVQGPSTGVRMLKH